MFAFEAIQTSAAAISFAYSRLAPSHPILTFEQGASMANMVLQQLNSQKLQEKKS
jgi:hypothetical protein